jgi:hypothetical protein
MTAATSAARIVVDNRVAAYVAQRCEAQIMPPFTAMGIERNGEIVAGVVFNNFSARDIDVTVAGERGAFTRGFLRAVGAYVFGALDCTRMSITTRHATVCDVAKRLGARMEGVKRDRHGPGQHAYMLGILKNDWAF